MHHTPNQLWRSELTFFSDESIRSLTGLLPQPMARQIKNLWEGDDAKLLGMSERNFLREFGLKFKHGPEPLDHTLRLQFWLEYHRTQDEDDSRPKINMSYVIGRSISKENFYRFYITDPMRLAFMLRPPIDYVAALQGAMSHAVLVLDEILEKGRQINPIEFAPMALKIFESLARKVGPQKIKTREPEEKKGDDEIVPAAPAAKDPDALRAEILKKRGMIAVEAPPPNEDEV